MCPFLVTKNLIKKNLIKNNINGISLPPISLNISTYHAFYSAYLQRTQEFSATVSQGLSIGELPPTLPYEHCLSTMPSTHGILLYPHHQHDIQIYYYSLYNKKFVRTCASVQVSDFIPKLSSSSAAHFLPAYFPLSP